MNDHFYFVGGTILILIGFLMSIKVVRHAISGLKSWVVVPLIDLVVFVAICFAAKYMFYESGIWVYKYVISNAYVKETFDSQTENLAYLAAIGVPALILLITFIILSIRQKKLAHTTPNGYVSCLFISGRTTSLLCGLKGWILWPFDVVHIQANIFNVQMPRAIAQEATRSSEADAKLQKEGEGFEAMTQFSLRRDDGSIMQSLATVKVKARLIGRLLDARNAVDFFSLGRKSETVNLDDPASPYRKQLEGDAVIGPALEVIRTHLASSDLLSDVYGVQSNEKKDAAAAAQKGAVNKNFLPKDKYDEILKRINEGQEHDHTGPDHHTKGANAAGFTFTDLNIEKVIPDAKTLETMTAGLKEIGEGVQEQIDQRTAKELLANLLKEQFGLSRQDFERLDLSRKEQIIRQLQVLQGKMTAESAGKLDVLSEGISTLKELFPLGATLFKDWISGRQRNADPTPIQQPHADAPQNVQPGQPEKPQSGPQPNWPKKQIPPPAIELKPKAEGEQTIETRQPQQRERFLRYHPDDVGDRKKNKPLV